MKNIFTTRYRWIWEIDKLRKEFFFLTMSKEHYALSKKYADITPLGRRFLSESNLAEVKKDEFLGELTILKEALDVHSERLLMERKEKVKAIFEELAPTYTSHEESTNHVLAQKEVINTLSATLFGDNPIILDIGTGTGIIPKILLEINSNIKKVIGIDISPKMISNKGICQDSECYYVCDIENSGQVKDILREYAPFDVIVFSFIFAWLSSRQKALDNVKNLIKPGSKILMLEEAFKSEKHKPMFSAGSDKESLLLEDLFKLADHMPLYELIDMMKDNGFKCVDDCAPCRIDDMHDVRGVVFEYQ